LEPKEKIPMHSRPDPRRGRALAQPSLATPLAFVAAFVAAAVAIAAPAAAQGTGKNDSRLPIPEAARTAAKTIDRASLEGPLRFLADDLLEGRGPASRGDELTQLYLASSLQLLGFEPGGDKGSYLQPFDIVGIEAQMPEAWTFQVAGKPVALARSTDYIASSGVQQERAAIDGAEVVFVGYGIEAPEYQWNDYKGMDLKGKVLVMLNNDPSTDEQLFAGERRLYYGRWTYKYESAARQGAAGVILLHTTPSAGYGWNVVQSSWTGEQFELPAGREPRIQVKAWATEESLRRLFQAAGKNLDQLVKQAQGRDFKPVPLGITTSLALPTKISKKKTANVLGLLPGSDPKLKGEVVVYSAHHDHFGIGDPDDTGDKIYNGAVDNAAGCAQLLAMAKAFAALPERPRRSILFAFVAGEEQGLLGSAYYASHPTFPPGRIAANINYDGGSFYGRTRDLTFIGFGKSSLDGVVQALAAEQGRIVKGDQQADRGFFYRSDQFNFAKIGIPAIYLDEGTDFLDKPEVAKKKKEEWDAKQYHQPSDEIDPDWSYDGVIEDARLGFLAGVAIAEDDKLPAWVPGDEFEAARKKALAEVGKAGDNRSR
jgi:Zn-dependent M28 family amino/carboxypeptidase